MIKSIKNFFIKLGYMLSFGAKGANDTILTQNPDSSDIGIFQNVETQNLGEALLKGELTESVKELRYSNYKVLKESDKYAYIGGGQTIKKNVNYNREKYEFYQNNSLICESIEHEFNRVGKYDTERYTFSFLYKDVMKFKIENYANYGKFEVDKDNIKVNLVFDKTTKNIYDPVSYGIMKELDKISKFTSSYQIENNDICSNPTILTFVTYKSNGEEDLVKYTLRDLTFDSCKETEDCYVLAYTSNNFSRIDLTDKFYNQNMENKYASKASKTQTVSINTEMRKEKCEICGSEMNVYDADVTRYEFGKAICTNCLKKHNLSIEN